MGFFIGLLAAYCAAMVFALILRGKIRRQVTGILASLGASAGLLLGITLVLNGDPFSVNVPAMFAGTGLALHGDSLSGLFLILLGLVAIPVGIYSIEYSTAYETQGSFVAFMLPAFLLSMTLVLVANNLITFLVCWEGMSITSYFFVMTKGDKPDVQTAGAWYAILSHIGLGAIIVALLLLSGNSDGTFAGMRSLAGSLPPLTRDLIFVMALIGFGSKAGMVPFHPGDRYATPVAPSYISALMSGAMLKIGIYGLLRVVFDILNAQGPAWWGALILGLGVFSALLGILYALTASDMKLFLTYHSIENIGIILMGLGAGLLFQHFGQTALSILSITAALYHTLNHALFKGLLFLAAGSIIHGAHIRDMDQMGGLIKRMPWTAVLFLIGAAAISALPPLNGFMSEWMLFQSLFHGFSIPDLRVTAIMAFSLGALALTSGLAAACFVKAFGISFLALPRSDLATNAKEVPGLMRWPMVTLAAGCVLFGLLPFAVIKVLQTSLSGTLAWTASAINTGGVDIDWFHITIAPGNSDGLSPLLILAMLGTTVLAVPLLLRTFRANQKTRRSDTWGCGRVSTSARQEYTARSFAEPLKRVFAGIFRPSHDLSIDFQPESVYFLRSISYRSDIQPWFEHHLYVPAIHAIDRFAKRVRWIQMGAIHLYLAYVVFTLLILLIFAR